MALEKVLALDSTGVIEKEIETGGGGGAGTATKQSITLSLGQTVVVVPGGYTAAGVLVFLNGAYLSPAEYAASASPSIVLAIGAPSTGSVLDVIVLAADGLAVLTGVHNLGVGSFAKNKIINGKMEIAQRGGSFPAASGYTLDAWVYAAASAAIVTISKGFVGGEFQSCLQATITTADAIISAGDVAAMQHRIEGYNITDLIGATFTLSFFVKSSKTGIHCCSLKNVAPNKSYVAEYTILEANVWEYKTITIVGGLPVAGTWNYTNGIGLRVLFAMVCGATYQTTPDAWQSGDFNATANQVNVLDTVGNSFAITGVQLELGSVATPFEHRPYGQELALCQRYYEMGGGNSEGFFCGDVTSGSTYYYGHTFQVSKRAPPTVTLTSQLASGFPSTASIFQGSPTTRGFATVRTSNATVNGGFYADSWTASSEL